MLFSIVLPVYNTPVKFLKKCIKSIINQKTLDFEIIIVDDCSYENNTIRYLQSLKYPNIKIIKNKQNIGLGPSRNIGLQNSSGKYIWFIDSDDWITNNALNLVIYKIKKFNPDIIFFNFDYIFNDKTITHKCHGLPYCTTWSKIFKIDFLKKNNLFHLFSKLPHEDEYFNLITLYNTNSYEYIDRTLYCYNKLNNDSITSNTNLKKSLKSLSFYLKHFKKNYSHKNSYIKDNNIFQDAIYQRYCMLFNDYYSINVFLYIKESMLFFSLRKYINWNLHSKKIKYIYFPLVNLLLFFYKNFFIK